MANDLNQCNFIGRVGRDPEVRYLASGTAVASFSLAVNNEYKGEKKTEWVNVVCFGKLAEVVGEYVTKGKQLYLSGRMQTDKWQDKQGNDRYTTKIITQTVQFLGVPTTTKSDTESHRNERRMTEEEYRAANDEHIPF